MSIQNHKMSDKSNKEILLDSKKWLRWLQEAIDNKHINYQKYSIFENIESIRHGIMKEVYKVTSTCFQKTVAIDAGRNPLIIAKTILKL